MMFSLPWPSLSRWMLTGARGLDHHPVLALLLIVGLPVAIAYWRWTLRAYALAAASERDRQRIVVPVVLGPRESLGVPYPARHLLDRIEPAPFGEWLLVHLVRRGMTESQLARQLGRPVAEVHAAMYGAPVGTHLPSATLVDAICDALQLDVNEARAVFYGRPAEGRSGSEAAEGSASILRGEP